MKALRIDDANNQSIPESVLITRIMSGEKELYEILLRRNNQKLFRVIRSYIKETPEIEDIMQNTYLKAYEKLYQFKQSSQFSTWLIRIGINETMARLREKGKGYIVHDHIHELENKPAYSNPERKIIRQEARQHIEQAIDSLDPKYRTVYMLKVVEGMSINEISECLDISSANVKVRMHRARATLKEKLYELTLNNDIFEFGFSKCDNLVERVMGRIG